MSKFKRAVSKRRSKNLIVITGCDSGIGLGLAKYLSKKGYTLVVSYLKDNHFQNSINVFSRKMDLTEPGDVRDFKGYLHELCGEGYRIKAVVVNAGVAVVGPVENASMELFRKAFEINFFGAVDVVKACITQIIREKGRIMIIGSMAGKVALPFLSPYASSKFAVEGFCDSLRREMNPLGVKTILLEPASVATPIWNKLKEQDASWVDEKYLKSLYALRDHFVEGKTQGMNGLDVDVAARQIGHILFRRNPKARYIIAKGRISSKLTSMAPSSIIDKAVVKMFRMYYGK